MLTKYFLKSNEMWNASLLLSCETGYAREHLYGMSRVTLCSCAGKLLAWLRGISSPSVSLASSEVSAMARRTSVGPKQVSFSSEKRDMPHSVPSSCHALKICPANYNKRCMRLALMWNDGESLAYVSQRNCPTMDTPYLPSSVSQSFNLMANSIASFSSDLSCHRHRSIIPFVPWWNRETQIFMP